VARGKAVYFYDAAGKPLATVEPSEGDALQCVTSVKGDIVAVVSFGGSNLRVYKVP